MAHLNEKLILECYPLLLTPQIFVAPAGCNVIEGTADQQWGWCTDHEKAQSANALRIVGRLAREVIVDVRRDPARIYAGEELFWYWATTMEGNVWWKLSW